MHKKTEDAVCILLLRLVKMEMLPDDPCSLLRGKVRIFQPEVIGEGLLTQR